LVTTSGRESDTTDIGKMGQSYLDQAPDDCPIRRSSRIIRDLGDFIVCLNCPSALIVPRKR